MLLKSLRLIACLLAMVPAAVRAAGVLSFQLDRGGDRITQDLSVQNGQAWINGLWGDRNLDALFDGGRKEAVLIDHGRQRYTPVTDDSVRKLTGRLEGMSDMLRGLNQQLRQLSPEQKARWGMLLEGLPLDAIEEAQRTLAGYQLEAIPKAQSIQGIPCEWMRLKPGGSAPTEFCLADVAALGLAEADRDTLKAMVGFSRLMLQRAQGLASHLGARISQADLDRLTGIPVILKGHRGDRTLTLTLAEIRNPRDALNPPRVPDGYRSESLRFW